ncbi:hypothetical protein Tco_0773787, partial [Tanacetum coccineum]
LSAETGAIEPEPDEDSDKGDGEIGGDPTCEAATGGISSSASMPSFSSGSSSIFNTKSFSKLSTGSSAGKSNTWSGDYGSAIIL